MSDDFVVTGAEDFARFSRALKAAGRGEMRKQLNKNMRDAAKPLIARTRAAAREQLPRRGGLSEIVARAPQRVALRTGVDAGVRIVVGKNRGAARTTSLNGYVRHPVFGRWVEGLPPQRVEPGWFDQTLEHAAATVLPALEQAIQTIVDQIAREAS